MPHASANFFVHSGLEATPVRGKKSRSKFRVATEARRRAREAAGPPPVERVIPDKRRKPPKHKKRLLEENL